MAPRLVSFLAATPLALASGSSSIRSPFLDCILLPDETISVWSNEQGLFQLGCMRDLLCLESRATPSKRFEPDKNLLETSNSKFKSLKLKMYCTVESSEDGSADSSP